MKAIVSVFLARAKIAGPVTLGLWLLSALVISGCAPSKPVPASVEGPAEPGALADLNETPAAAGAWRPHRLAACPPEGVVPGTVERYLGICSEYFRGGSGSDAIVEMEMGLAEGQRHSLMLLTLGQLYLLAGQGDPDLLPNEGPAADVGNWERNQSRLLGRAEELLQEAARARPFDAAVDYLLADVARAAGNRELAAQRVAVGMQKCTEGRSFSMLWHYQGLNNHSGRYLGGPAPVYPKGALDKGVTGDVVLDVLLSPAAEVRQLVEVESPAKSLSQAAGTSLRKGRFEAARVGKYPIWSWVRVTTAFQLEE